MKYLKHIKNTLATCAFSAMSPCYLNEWRLVVAELDAGIRSSRRRGAHRYSSNTGNSPAGRHHTKLLHRLLAGVSVIEARQFGGACVEWPQADVAMEAEWGRLVLTPVEAHRDKIRKRMCIEVVFTRSIIEYRIYGETCVLSNN
jgi:hypothetical protein